LIYLTSTSGKNHGAFVAGSVGCGRSRLKASESLGYVYKHAAE